MKGQSKLRLINTYIWDQPWFIELNNEEKLSYFYMHIKCSDVGIYLHSEKAMMNHLGHTFTFTEIMEWLNKKRENVIDLGNDILLFQWFIKDHSKRGTKIKPTSNPDLGKVREAIDSEVLDHLIINGTFSPECKYFEFGISESIIENKSYSTHRKNGKEYSPYEEMVKTVKAYINHEESLGKPFQRFIEGLPKVLQNVLITNPANNETQDQTQIQAQSVYKELAKGFKFDCADFLIEEEVKSDLESIGSLVENVDEWILCKKKEYRELRSGKNDWRSFLKYISE
ncbi:MAG: hypothetical protein WDZ80_00515 [Candidatus Paceibacterota bacterium]